MLSYGYENNHLASSFSFLDETDVSIVPPKRAHGLTIEHVEEFMINSRCRAVVADSDQSTRHQKL